jgi:excisionase family DNA binding protein
VPGIRQHPDEARRSPAVPSLADQASEYRGTLLTFDQTAHALGVCRRTMERWIASGDFPIEPVLLGRRRRWRRADIERWLNGDEEAA